MQQILRGSPEDMRPANLRNASTDFLQSAKSEQISSNVIDSSTTATSTNVSASSAGGATPPLARSALL